MTPIDKINGENLLNPTLIAQIASRIYNEIPGASNIPKNETEVASTTSSYGNPETVLQNAPITDYADPLDLSDVNNLWEHEGNPETYQELGLQSTSRQTDVVGKLQDADLSEYYFLKKSDSAKEAPLSTHADNLVNQQNFTENKENAPSLHQFVQRVQSVSDEFSENKQANPFYQSLENGLPSDHFDFSFLFANAQTQVDTPLQEVQSPYYFIHDQQPISGCFRGNTW